MGQYRDNDHPEDTTHFTISDNRINTFFAKNQKGIQFENATWSFSESFPLSNSCFDNWGMICCTIIDHI